MISIIGSIISLALPPDTYFNASLPKSNPSIFAWSYSHFEPDLPGATMTFFALNSPLLVSTPIILSSST